MSLEQMDSLFSLLIKLDIIGSRKMKNIEEIK